MKRYILLIVCLINFFASPLLARAETKEQTTSQQSVKLELADRYVEEKMAMNDRVEAYKQKFREFSQSDAYKDLLKEDPEAKKVVGEMSILMNDFSNQVDQIFFIHLKDYRDQLEKIQKQYDEGKLELSPEAFKFVSDYSLTEPEELKKKEFTQDDLFTHLKSFAYYQQVSALSPKLASLYQKYFADLATKPEAQQSYEANRDHLVAMYREFSGLLAFEEELTKEELATIDQRLKEIKEEFKQIEEVPVEQAVKEGLYSK